MNCSLHVSPDAMIRIRCMKCGNLGNVPAAEFVGQSIDDYECLGKEGTCLGKLRVVAALPPLKTGSNYP